MLQEIKNYLKITWDDEDATITELINRGKAKLNELVGAELDFETEGLSRSLLFDYVRYAYNNASEYWEENYQHEILRLQLMISVSMLEEDADAEE
jgi:hypothetical protein